MNIKIITLSVLATVLFLLPQSAKAFHFEEKEAIARAAHIVDDKAEHLHRWAEKRQHHFDRYEERALRSLHYFAEQARHFHEVVESWHGRRHLQRDFRQLLMAWNDVAYNFHFLHADQHVYNDYLEARDAVFHLEALAQETETLNHHDYRRGEWWEYLIRDLFR